MNNNCLSCFKCSLYLKYFFYSIKGGELFERVIDENFVLTERLCELYIMQICEGINFMHKSNILHLDLKVYSIFQNFFKPF